MKLYGIFTLNEDSKTTRGDKKTGGTPALEYKSSEHKTSLQRTF